MNEPRRQPSPGEKPALVIALLFPVVAAYFYFVVAGESTWLRSIYAVSKVVQFGFPVAWMAWAEGRQALRSLMHLPAAGVSGHTPGSTARPLAGLPAGLATGLLMAGGLAGAYALVLRGGELMAAMAPRIIARIDSIGAATPVRYLLLALFLSILHSWLEEYYWRGFVFARLRRRLGSVAAVVVSSLGFAAHHVIVLDAFLGPQHRGTTVMFSLVVAAAGALWAWLYVKNRSLLSPWLSHLCVDIAIMAVGYDLAWGM